MKSSTISGLLHKADYDRFKMYSLQAGAFGRVFLRDRVSQLITSAIFAVIVLFIFANFGRHVAVYLGASNDFFLVKYFDFYRVDTDAGMAEWYMYLLTAVCAFLLVSVFRATREPVYAAWALIFLFVVADDALMIHETVGEYLVVTLGIPALPKLRPVDSGELIVWATAGVFFLSVLLWSFARSGRTARVAGGLLAIAFAALIFFAVVVDMLGIALTQPGTRLYKVLAITEDGGEMLSIGLACAIALLLYRHPALASEPKPSPARAAVR